MKRIRARLTAEMRALRGHNAQMVLIRLNPIIRGWSAYYRHGVSARVFNELDHHVWKLVYKWAKSSHPHKSKHWIIARYFGAFNSTRRDRWVFGDRDSGAYLLKFAWTDDHPAHAGQGLGVPGRPGPGRLLGGPASTRETPAGPGPATAVAQAARAMPALRAPAAPHRPRAGAPRRVGTLDHSHPQGGLPPRADLRHRARGHRHDHRVSSHPHPLPRPPARRHRWWTSTSAVLSDRRQGLLEPVARKRARPVLRGPGRSNAPRLPDYWAADTLAELGAHGASGAPAGGEDVLAAAGEERRTRRRGSGRPAADGPAARGVDRPARHAGAARLGAAPGQAGRAALEPEVPGPRRARRRRGAGADERPVRRVAGSSCWRRRGAGGGVPLPGRLAAAADRARWTSRSTCSPSWSPAGCAPTPATRRSSRSPGSGRCWPRCSSPRSATSPASTDPRSWPPGPG